MEPEKLTKGEEDLIGKIAKENKFNEFDLKVKQGSLKGENFLSVIKNVEIIDIKTHRSLHIFLKCAQPSELLRKQFPINDIFKREIACYTEVFERFRKLHAERNARYQLPYFAHVHGHSTEVSNELLALEDLKKGGFKLWDRMQPMDEKHITTILKEYGKIHGFSYAIKNLYPEEFADMCKKFYSLFHHLRPDEEARETTRKEFDEVIKLLDNAKLIEAMRRFRDEAHDHFMSIEEKKSVLIHGDCWCNNFLFKYGSEDQDAELDIACLIDWQIAMMGPPVVDLSYFLCTCAPKAILDDYQKYLKIYHESLSRMYQELGGEPSRLITFQELLNEWRDDCKLGLSVSISVLKIMLSNAGEAPDISTAAESGENIMDAFQFETSNQKQYMKRLSDVIAFMVENNFI